MIPRLPSKGCTGGHRFFDILFTAKNSCYIWKLVANPLLLLQIGVAMKTSELLRLMQAHGCYRVSQGKEHDVWYSPITCARIRIPRHQSKEVPIGTLKAILKQAGI